MEIWSLKHAMEDMTIAFGPMMPGLLAEPEKGGHSWRAATAQSDRHDPRRVEAGYGPPAVDPR